MNCKWLYFLGMIVFLIFTGCSSTIANEEKFEQTQTHVAADIFASQTASNPTSTNTPTLTATPANSHTPTLTATITSTPTATIIPAKITIWDNLDVDEVCLQISQRYPQFEEDFRLPVFDSIKEVLTAMEMEVREGDAGCEMMITVGIEGTVYQQKYSGSGETVSCYTGARIDGYMRAETDGYPSIDIPLGGSYSPMMITGGCADEPTTNVTWDRAWAEPVIKGLAGIWGPPLAVAGLKSSNYTVRESSVSLIKIYGPEAAEAAPLLIAMLEDKQGGVAWVDVAAALGQIGPAAIAAVPALIENYASALNSPQGLSWEYRDALRNITGQEYEEEDAAPYRAWWEMYTQADVTALTETLLSGEKPEDRISAAGLLAMKAGQDALPTLIQALQDPNPAVRTAVTKLLGLWGPAAEEAASILIDNWVEAFSHKAYEEESTISVALFYIGTGAIPALVEFSAKNTESVDSLRNYHTLQNHALFTLEQITGLEQDRSKFNDDREGYRKDLLAFLERCQNYYEEQKND